MTPIEQPVSAAVVRGCTLKDARRLLEQALRETGIWDSLGVSAPKGAGSLRAVVLVAMSPPAAADSALVECLVDLLIDRGWPRVAVAGALSVRDRDRGHTDVGALARAAGYRGTTSAGGLYDVIDLHEELVTAPVAEPSMLFGRQVSLAWAEAGLRVVVARNVTDVADRFALCLDTLLGVVPQVPGADRADTATEICFTLPAQVAIVDALVSSHGLAGSLVLRSLDTAALVVGGDALLVDVVAAGLQGIDPAASRLDGAALRRRGLPAGHRILGDVTPFRGWQPAPALACDAIRCAGALAPVAERVLTAALCSPDDSAAIDSDAVLGWLRSVLGPLVDTDAAMLDGLLAASGYGIAGTAHYLRAWNTVFAKDRIDRVEVPLGFAHTIYSEADYRGLASYLSSLEGLLDGVPVAESGVRWRYLDRSVLFEVERVIEAPYAEFVARVDVAEGISLMADYVGGRAVPVAWDDAARVVMRAERNVYLTQPNYLAFWGGKPIDVCKIELVEYGQDHCRLLWRTVASPNGSADYDDGSLTFADVGAGRTQLTVRGRQLFTLPPFWQAADLDRFPDIKNALVVDAYRRFFSATFDNLEACYEGRDFRIGREPADPAAPLPTIALSGALDMAREWLAEMPLSERLRRWQGGDDTASPRPVAVDADGFRHFSGTSAPSSPTGRASPFERAWREWTDGYVTAVTADWSRRTQP